MRWLVRGVVTLVVLIVIIAGGGYVWLRGSLPQVDGRIEVAGLSGPIEIVRDRNSVPHIYARSAIDAQFGLGFVHAQDRLWQMEMNRRIGAARLSEVVGEAGLPIDRFLRTLGIYGHAERTLDNLDIETRAALEAYAAGVNAFLATRGDPLAPLPPEFVILRHTPEEWRPADSLAWTKMMAWDLSGNWGAELLRARMARRLTPRQIGDLYPPYPDDGIVALEEYAALLGDLPLDALHAALPAPPEPNNGSNNWVLSGERTATGKPLLANDPHLGLGAPSLWYFAHLNAPGLDVIGATLPGVPTVVLGRNDRIAWGFTNTGPDTQDLFIERIDPANPLNYLTPAGSQPFETRREVISIKGGEDEILNVRATRHGPVISDILDSAREVVAEREVLAFAWTALRDDDLTAQAGRKLNQARNWSEFLGAMRDFHSPQQNIVYADVDGNIGFYAPARVPLRDPDNALRGMMPSPGWTGTHDWTGFIPFDELPNALNPDVGAIATANNRIVPEDYPYYLTSEWGAPYRAERIDELLNARERHSIQSFKDMQGDVRSPFARVFLPYLLGAEAAGETAAESLSLLQTWDGIMDRDRPEPLIFSAWYRELTRLVYADELGDLFEDYWSFRPIFMANVLSGESQWCNDISTGPRETCEGQISLAFERALATLQDDYGDDVSKWRWGDAHHAHSEHRPLSGQPVVGTLFDIDLPSSGDAETLAAARFRISDSENPFRQFHGASLRAIYDLDDPNRSIFIHSSGQSGNILSGYRSFAEAWRNVEYVPMTTDRREIEIDAVGTLLLDPAP
jgi:penicillin amidase